MSSRPRVEDGYPEIIGRLKGGEIRYQRTAATSAQPGKYFHPIETDGLDVAIPDGATLHTQAGVFRLGKGSVLLTDRLEQANPRRRRKAKR